MLKIGNLTLRSKVLLAPLAGITDSSFRILCRRFGASFTFVEMINARAVSYKNKKTLKMLSTDPQDKPIGIQLVGCEIPYLLKAVDIISAFDFDLLDFNAACPVRKVCRRGEGASLLKDLKKFSQILKELSLKWRKPLTVKIRSGWDEKSRNAADAALAAQDSGADAIFIHGRDRQQFYKGNVDYKIIADVKKRVSVPVVASGDIWDPELAKKMLDETGCDGILVARGCLGNPWIFRQIEDHLKDGSLPQKPGLEEVLSVMEQHLDLLAQEHGEKNAVPLMRKFIGWYLKGREYARRARQQVNSIKTRQEFLGLLDQIRQLAGA